MKQTFGTGRAVGLDWSGAVLSRFTESSGYRMGKSNTQLLATNVFSLKIYLPVLLTTVLSSGSNKYIAPIDVQHFSF